MNFMEFLKEFIISPTKTGAIAPSSHGLAELITEIANLSKAASVLEFGSGTGVFTEKIPEKTHFFAIESKLKSVHTESR